jgi:hypothetical protein
MATIHNVKLEFLRPGPAHNQLLSPLTSYIALCGSEGQITVAFPFEHRQLLSRLERLRYVTSSGVIPPSQAEAEVREMGEMIGNVLGEVRVLGSEIGNALTSGKGLVHLRLSLSAYELALVPFEFAVSPDGFPGSGSPLFLQSRSPVTVTREVRRERPLPVSWNRCPRILFAFASPGPLPAVPGQEHLEALRRAVDPWVKWGPTPEDRVKGVKSLITVMPEATVEKIRQACGEAEFTHVHVLAHGAPFEEAGDRRYGVVLCGENDASVQDIVDGERLALALTGTSSSESACRLPTLLSLATCDSGNVGTVLTPGGSIAHELHAGGIPWVIASQFPLHMSASSMAVETLYKGVLQGDDPRWVLYEMRQRLRTGSASTHDWASIVAYATVPWDFERQVEAFRNRQVGAGVDVKFDKAEKLVTASSKGGDPAIESLYTEIREELTREFDRLPASAPPWERADHLGKMGAGEKRIGILFQGQGHKKEARAAYDAACDFYRRAIEADPANHWVITQYLSLRAVLAGKDEAGLLARGCGDWWIAGRQMALWELRSATGEKKAWAHGTLAELEMLGAVYAVAKGEKKGAKGRVVEHCRALRDLGGRESFPVLSTARQFRRYLDCWKRDAWQDLAEAAVAALEEAAP